MQMCFSLFGVLSAQCGREMDFTEETSCLMLEIKN